MSPLLRAARRHFQRTAETLATLAPDVLSRVLDPALRRQVSGATLLRHADSALTVVVILVAAAPVAPLAPVTQLIGAAACAILGHAELAHSRDFWRNRATLLNAARDDDARAEAAARAAAAAEWRRIEAGLLEERRAAQAEAARLHELTRILGLKIVTALDAERQRIARDLHDEQAQLLSAARIALHAAPERVPQILKELDDALRKCVRELRPATLGKLDLDAALSLELDRLNAAGIQTRVTGRRVLAQFSRPVQELCYKIAREAVSNILRHSQARRAVLSFALSGASALLRIVDDGAGFAPPARRAPGVGLAAMAERLELMGGALKLERSAGKTRLTATIPQF